jgi:hypothetical protein
VSQHGESLRPDKESRRVLAKGETKAALEGSRDDRGIEVPKKRVTIVEGSIPVIDNRKKETRRVHTAWDQLDLKTKLDRVEAKDAGSRGEGVQSAWALNPLREAGTELHS